MLQSEEEWLLRSGIPVSYLNLSYSEPVNQLSAYC